MKNFLITLFVKQNEYHKYSVLGHTIAVTKECFKAKKYNLIPAAILHDIGKPVVAFQDDEDKQKGTYSFRGHEEKSYQIIKRWPISNRTKLIVRYHYLITGMAADMRKYEKTSHQKFKASFEKRLEVWNSLDEKNQEELMIFKMFDDIGKGYPEKSKAIPSFLADRYEIVQQNVFKEETKK